MIVRINGRELTLERPKLAVVYVSPGDFLLSLGKKITAILARIIPSGAMMAAAPVGGIAGKLWPIITRMQDLGLALGIGFGLWGVYLIMIGNPEGKQKLIQAVLGFIGLFLVPELFISIYETFRGGV